VTIDHRGERPVYLQLAAILRAQIVSGELEPGRPIPSEVTLTQRYGVARGTARKAVGLLRDEGLVRFVFGRGTFVVPESERPA
jgi:GntR family transcriptional regulator